MPQFCMWVVKSRGCDYIISAYGLYIVTMLPQHLNNKLAEISTTLGMQLLTMSYEQF